MLSKPKKVKKVARIISDPVVNFVSLVSHAANQTPFKKIKNDESVDDVLDSTANELLQLSAKVSMDDETDVEVSRPESGSVMMQKMEFDKEYFTKKIANEKLKELGFTDYTILSEDNKWIAKSDFYEQFEDNIGTINGGEGLKLFIGKIKKDNEEVEEPSVELTESMSETGLAIELKIEDNTILKQMDSTVVQKFDKWSAYYCGDKTLAEAIEDGLEYDPLPFGTEELMAAFMGAVKTACRENDSSAIRTAANDMGDILVALHQVTNMFMESENEGLQLMAKELKKSLEGNAEEVVTEVPAEEVVEDEKVEGQEEATPTEEVAPETDAEPAKVEKSANEDLLLSIKSMLQETVSSLKKENEKVAKSIEERLEKLEGVSTQKRSQEVSEEETKKVEKSEVKEITAYKIDSKIADIMGL